MMKRIVILLIAMVMITSCGTARKAEQEQENKKNEEGTEKEFVPTHPPVVIPHSWRESFN